MALSRVAVLITVVALTAACAESPEVAGPEGPGATVSTSARPSSPPPDDEDPREPTTPESTDTPPVDSGPPPVTVRYGDDSVDLRAYTFCYGSMCADGIAPEDPPDVGEPEEVLVDFPLENWRFWATFTPTGERCGRNHTVRLEPAADGTLPLEPLGPPGTYDVTLFGRGNGDLVTVFRWTTPTRGPMPKPTSRLAILADHDGDLDSYGVELSITNLARTPDSVHARVTVTAANGKSLTFEPNQSPDRCLPPGTVRWDGPDAQGRAAADLGPAPASYRVELVLDGTRYVGTAEWPTDVVRGEAPSVSLDFSPDLPALR